MAGCRISIHSLWELQKEFSLSKSLKRPQTPIVSVGLVVWTHLTHFPVLFIFLFVSVE